MNPGARNNHSTKKHAPRITQLVCDSNSHLTYGLHLTKSIFLILIKKTSFALESCMAVSFLASSNASLAVVYLVFSIHLLQQAACSQICKQLSKHSTHQPNFRVLIRVSLSLSLSWPTAPRPPRSSPVPAVFGPPTTDAVRVDSLATAKGLEPKHTSSRPWPWRLAARPSSS